MTNRKPPSVRSRGRRQRAARNVPLTASSPLSEREQRLVDHYLITLSPRRAAIAAGYKATNAHIVAHQVLSRPNVDAALQRAFIARMERTAITQDVVVYDIQLAAHVSPADLFDADGKMLPLRFLPRHVAEAIIGLRWNKSGTKLVEIRLRNNTPFHELLAKHMRVGVEAPPPSLADVPAFILPEGTEMKVH